MSRTGGLERSSRSFQSVNQRLLREFLDDRLDGPSQPCWHVARQRNRSALDVHTIFTLFDSPVGIQAPKESITCIGRQYFLFWTSRVFHLSDARRIRATNPVRSIYGTILHFMISIEDYGYDFLFEEPKANLEIQR